MKKFSGVLIILLLSALLTVTAFGSNSMPVDEWAPTSITLSETNLRLVKSQPKFTLAATVNPEYATQDVVWSSSNTNIVSVSTRGVVSAKKIGSATITCTSKANSSIKAYCYVTVTDPIYQIEDVEVDKSEYTCVVGKRVKLQYTISPSNASNTYIHWDVEDDDICSVDNSGNVYGKAAGETSIVGTTDDGGFSMEFYVSVDESNMNTFDEFEDTYQGLKVRRQTGVDEGIWIELTTGEYLFYDNYEGKFVSGWFEANGKTYFSEDYTFELVTNDENGYWNDDDEWIQYYTTYTLPVMKTGWLQLPSAWTYLKADGEAARNEWVFEGKQWYYLDKDGYMKTDLFTVGSYSYVTDSSGACQVGFVSSEGKSYYCDPGTLAVKRGWIEINGQWYYGDDRTGELFKNAYVSTGEDRYWYYLKEDGQLLIDGTTPEGYVTNSNGICRK